MGLGLQLSLQPDLPVYFPGQIVVGHLHVDVESDTKLKCK